MNKFGIVLGVAAVATLAGCKDPDYKYGGKPSQNEVKRVPEAVEIEPVARPVVEPAPESRPVIIADMSKPAEAEIAVDAVKPEPAEKVVDDGKAAEAETTEYIVQRGDYLAKISKKFNIKVDAIRKANPQIKNDVIRIGQKIKLPGKVEVGEQKVPEGAIAKSAAVKKAFVPYTGATKEYVVKSGDTLGAIAYSNGINIRQLKQLNSLTKDSLKVGQKLKIPVGGEAVAASVVKAVEAKPVEVKPVEKPVAAPVAPVPVAAPVEQPAPSAPAVEEAPVAPVAESAQEGSSQIYVVQEGDDLTNISIRWGVSSAEIRELNNLADDDQVKPGMKIKLPAEADL